MPTTSTLTTHGLIEVFRPPLWVNKLRAYAIYVDGKKAGKIKDSKTATISVPPGSHTVWLRIDCFRSNPIQVDVAPDKTVRLIVEKNPNRGWKYWGTLVAAGIILAIGVTLLGAIGGGIAGGLYGAIYGAYFCRPRLKELPDPDKNLI